MFAETLDCVLWRKDKKEWNTIISAQLQLEAKFLEQREFKLNFQLHFSPMAHTFICLICNFVCSIFWNACMNGTGFPYQTILTIKWMRCICLKIFVRFYTVLGLALVRSGFAIHFHLIFNGKIMCPGRANSRSWFDCKCAKPIEQKQPVLHYNTSLPFSLSQLKCNVMTITKITISNEWAIFYSVPDEFECFCYKSTVTAR